MSRVNAVDAIEVALASLGELQLEFSKRGHEIVARTLRNLRSMKNSIPLDDYYGTVELVPLPMTEEPLYLREYRKHLLQLREVLHAMEANAPQSIPSGDASDCVRIIEELEGALAAEGLQLAAR